MKFTGEPACLEDTSNEAARIQVRWMAYTNNRVSQEHGANGKKVVNKGVYQSYKRSLPVLCQVVHGIGVASAFGLVGAVHGRVEHPQLRVEHPQERHGNEITNVEQLRRVGSLQAE